LGELCGDYDALVKAVLVALLQSPVDYRHALGILDPAYEEWRPQGKPAHELVFVAGVPLLVVNSEGEIRILRDPDDAAAEAIAGYVTGRDCNVLEVLGDAALGCVKPLFTSGTWSYSRNYGVTANEFRPAPAGHVRALTPDDRLKLRVACDRVERMRGNASTWRDFDYMAHGYPVTCYGAFAGDEIVGFCSANPICRGVTEISWIVVDPAHHRQGFASAMLTAQARQAFARGDAIGYHSGRAGDDVDAMVRKLGFRELRTSYRFVPSSSPDQWRAWGKPL
jgi:ribosomal protein S18 acetylase RimI-like enzyme